MSRERLLRWSMGEPVERVPYEEYLRRLELSEVKLESLREYVRVSQGEPRVEVFQREGTAWILRTYTAGQSFDLPSQGIAISVDAIYADPRQITP